MIERAVALGLAALLLIVASSDAAVRRVEPLLAGAARVDVAIPPGTPLAGYGGFPRRAWIPDVLGRVPNAFWFRPAEGVHDSIRVRGLVLERGATRALWLAVDLVGVDPSLVAELADRLRARHGMQYAAIVVSASHTHSGPGAYADSALFGVVAVDRPSGAVRAALLDSMTDAARKAEAGKARVGLGVSSTVVRALQQSRVRGPLDPELGVLKIAGVDGRPVALVWNYAIHGTALGRENFLLSGDLMSAASDRIERALGVPALFVNGAVADVSPRPRGWAGVAEAGRALATGAITAWQDARPDARARLEIATERVALPPPALSLRNCLGRWIPSSVMLGLADALPSTAELIALALGDSAWVTVPGELETSLGVAIKAAARDRFRHAFVAGVSNDYLGYFLTPADYQRPSYIACASLYGERGGSIVRDAAIAALRRIDPAKAAR